MFRVLIGQSSGHASAGRKSLTPSVCQITIVSPSLQRLNPPALCCYSACLHSHQLAVRQCTHRQRWAQGRAHQKCACCITKAVPSRAVTHARSHPLRLQSGLSFTPHVRRLSADILTHLLQPIVAVHKRRGIKTGERLWLCIRRITLIRVNSKLVHDSKNMKPSTSAWLTFALRRI